MARKEATPYHPLKLAQEILRSPHQQHVFFVLVALTGRKPRRDEKLHLNPVQDMKTMMSEASVALCFGGISNHYNEKAHAHSPQGA